MSTVKQILSSSVPIWPFDLANRVLIPIAIMAFGMWRTWSTAQTPFEQTVGLLLSIAVALMWGTYFAVASPHNTRMVDA